jgi:hypothetical protein
VANQFLFQEPFFTVCGYSCSSQPQQIAFPTPAPKCTMSNYATEIKDVMASDDLVIDVRNQGVT